jgi:proline iminopeptidase
MKSIVSIARGLPVLLSFFSVQAWVLVSRVQGPSLLSQPSEPCAPFSATSTTQLSSSPDQFGSFGAKTETVGRREILSPSRPQPLPLRELYPASVARLNGTIQVDSLHTLYYEVHGTANANVAQRASLFLHGGPGAGCSPTHARFFNPELYDTVVLFDQRGCGRSTPRGLVFNNTLTSLIADCEQLREHILGPDGVWHTILGGSWGSTLAIAYAQEHPERIKSLILRGVCLLRPSEIDWLFTPQGGAALKNPQAWQAFAETVGKGANSDDGTTNVDAANKVIDRAVLDAYYDRMLSRNATERWMAARGWMTWEFTVSSSFNKQQEGQQPTTPVDSPAVLVSYSSPGGWAYQDRYGRVLELQEADQLGLPVDSFFTAEQGLRQGLPQASQKLPEEACPEEASLSPRPFTMSLQDFEEAGNKQVGNFTGLPALPLLTCFYSVNDRFVMNGWELLNPSRMDRIRDIPCIAVQGGQDPICPPDTALDVKQQWPGMELRIPLRAGHSMYHPELVHELVQATDRIGRYVE